jgi:hypothetical protein
VTAPKTATITLAQPIQRRSKQTGEVVDSVETLTLQPPTAGDMADALDAAEGDPRRMGSMTRFLACRCTGLTRAEFDNLSLEDGAALMTAVAGFLGNGQATGPTH